MPRMSRLIVPGYPHHVTQRGVRSMDIFTDDDARWAYLSFLSEESGRVGVQILSWCLMSNHVHFIAIPSDSRSLARAFGEAHRRYTRMRNFCEGVRGYLFQGRFSSCVLDGKHLVAAARYVERNPVKAGIVSHPGDYLWSSARFHLGIIAEDMMVSDKSMLGMVSDWESLLLSENEEDSMRLRLSTRTGRPAGGDDFAEKVKNLTGRDPRPQRPGRPRKGE
ncbi:MAG TPA: transposase [Anaerolineaceae bacterium]|nr:transposase [Anaerolineaceae bacterium]